MHTAQTNEPKCPPSGYNYSSNIIVVPWLQSVHEGMLWKSMSCDTKQKFDIKVTLS